MRVCLAGFCAAFLFAAQSWAALPFSDNFESGVNGSIWKPWTTGGNDNLLTGDTSHNHTPAGNQAARANASDPATWNGYADFGATTVPAGQRLRADVWLFEDFNNNGTNPAQPVTNMLALFGDAATPNAFTDYIQLGVVPFFPGGSQTYGFRTRYNDATGGGIIDTGVSRKPGWTELSIEADPYSSGGAVRFFIDGVLKGSSFRAGGNGGAGGLSQVDLRYVRLGNNSKTYENFWYDDVSVSLVPEPASIFMLAMSAGALGMIRGRRNGRSLTKT
jgi:hypothetical protein